MKPGERTEATKAFEVLVAEHHRAVLAYAHSLVKDSATAEDLAQEAFVTAWQKLDTFDSSRDFGKWVRGILRNKYCNLARKKKMQMLEPEMLEAIDAQYNGWHDGKSSHEERLMDRLAHCLEQLTQPLRQAIDLYYLQEQACSAIAALAGAQEATIRKRLQLGRTALADCIERTSQNGSERGDRG